MVGRREVARGGGDDDDDDDSNSDADGPAAAEGGVGKEEEEMPWPRVLLVRLLMRRGSGTVPSSSSPRKEAPPSRARLEPAGMVAAIYHDAV